MADDRRSPGPIADRVFESGFRAAALLGVLGVGILFWFGPLSPTDSMHVSLTLLLYPVYLLFIAVLLGAWLGYETDGRNLERVTEPAEMESGEAWKRWPW